MSEQTNSHPLPWRRLTTIKVSCTSTTTSPKETFFRSFISSTTRGRSFRKKEALFPLQPALSQVDRVATCQSGREARNQSQSDWYVHLDPQFCRRETERVSIRRQSVCDPTSDSGRSHLTRFAGIHERDSGGPKLFNSADPFRTFF